MIRLVRSSKLKMMILGTCACLAIPLAAQAKDYNLMTSPTLTGDWGGVRTTLNDEGITPYATYTGQYANGQSGGARTGDAYAQQIAFGINLDLKKLANLNGAKFFIGFNAREGHNTSAYIGNKMAVQSVYGSGENINISNLSYEQSIGKHFLTQVGFMPLGNAFAYTPLMLDFQNSGFYGHPLSLPFDSGWADYPVAHWGGLVKFMQGPAYFQTGVFDVNPENLKHGNGLDMSLDGSTGVIIPMELGLKTKFGANALPGIYKIGGYYDTSKAPDQVSASIERSGRYGGYILAQQMLISTDKNNKTGITGFAQFTDNDRETSLITYYVDAGAIYQGPFASRPSDYISLGYVRAFVNNRKIQATYSKLMAKDQLLPDLASGEAVIEAGYSAQVTPWFRVYPNLQYVINPGAFALKTTSNAFVFGLSTQVKF